MTFNHWLVVISAIISTSGSFVYIKETIKGRTKPNRVTWFMWALGPLVATCAALFSGADIWATSRIFFAGFWPIIIFFCSFVNPQSYWKLNWFDLFCGACSLLAIFVWIFLKSPVYAILVAAIGDGFATIPTLIKAWKYPQTETGIGFVLGIISNLIIFPAIPKWNIENSAFQIYLLLSSSAIAFSIYRKTILKKIIKL